MCVFIIACLYPFLIFDYPSISYQLGMRRGFNNYLNDTHKKYTFFVPRDYAWKEAGIKFPSTTKVLMMPDYAYHVSIPFKI